MITNQDFTKRAYVNSNEDIWHKSPADGVERLYLERDDGGEYAIATTIVRFDPGSKFEQHVHDGGEEFLVLDGVFSDEFGSYPKGAYVRNPKVQLIIRLVNQVVCYLLSFVNFKNMIINQLA